MDQPMNQQLVLIGGESATGKSAALRNIRNQERWMYLNCEAGKRLPFRNNFETNTVTDPMIVFQAMEYIKDNPDYDGVIIDSITFLMDMFEEVYINTAEDTRAAWGNYASYFTNLMQQHIAGLGKSVIMTGHTAPFHDEKRMQTVVRLAIRGKIGNNNGAESYFSTVVSAKKVDVDELAKTNQALLNITPKDEAVGYKHVFQVNLTKDTRNERIRGPMDLFPDDLVYMDNDAQLLLDHLADFYGLAKAA